MLVVPVVADEVADIVQQRRRLEHLPGAFVEYRVVGNGGEDRQGQFAHLFAVFLVRVAGSGEILDRRQPVALVSRRVPSHRPRSIREGE